MIDKTTEIKLRCLKCEKIRTAKSFDYSANMCKAGRGGHLWTIVWTGGTEGQKPQTTDDLKHLAAELKQLRNIIAFYGVEIMPDGSFTSPRITQNEVDVKKLREFVGAMNSIGIEEWVGRWKQRAFWFYDSAGIPVEYGTDPFDAWQKLQGESK